MFNFLKPKKTSQENSPNKDSSQAWHNRFKSSLTRTRQQFSDKLTTLLRGKKAIDQSVYEEIETLLLLADVGVETTQYIIDTLTTQASRKQLAETEALLPLLQKILADTLLPCCKPLKINDSPFVILMVGINGAGKTTSIAKLAHYYKNQGHSVMLAAGDTFRAAAVEQLKAWGEHNKVPVIAQHPGADSASVIYDAMETANAKKVDILIADTAGRLHTQSHLMEELKKVKRVIAKQNPKAPHEIMLVIDASLGQNVLNQAKQFNEALQVSGITITKLDGSAKGGIVFALAKQLDIPLRFVGFGEQIEDLKPFDAESFVAALLVENEPV